MSAPQAWEMNQQVGALPIKTKDLRSISRPHMVKGKNLLLQVDL